MKDYFKENTKPFPENFYIKAPKNCMLSIYFSYLYIPYTLKTVNWIYSILEKNKETLPRSQSRGRRASSTRKTRETVLQFRYSSPTRIPPWNTDQDHESMALFGFRIYRGPCFHVVVWFDSSTTPSPTLRSEISTDDIQEDWERGINLGCKRGEVLYHTTARKPGHL
jgi:hypothetical protein